MTPEIVRAIEEMADRSGRFRPEAYFWVLRILDFTRREFRRAGHVTGRELLEGGRRLALQEFGPMAYEVLTHWGLQSTEDVGAIVFELVDAGILGKTEEDSLGDFVDAYDFKQAFVRDYPW